MRVLFLCVANSARSQMAHGWARALAADGVEVRSAGSDPTTPRPEAIAVMREVGIDLAAHRSTSVRDEPVPDVVITLCDDEVCPHYPGEVERLHWGMPDPAGHDEPWPARLERFRETRDRIGRRIEAWLEERGRRVAFGAAVRDRFALRPDMTFLNHGSFGATPRVVLERQRALQDELEAQPLRFMRSMPERIRGAAGRVAGALGVPPGQLAFVENATTGVNAVLRSLRLQPGDGLLTTNHVYGAVRNTLAHVCATTGAHLVEARVPFPLEDPAQVVEAVEGALTDDVKVAVLDHMSSITGLVFPIEALVRLCHERGVRVLVDGAHVPGHLPVDLPALGADWWVGNLHKWWFTPKGCAVLVAGPEAQEGLHPTVISHGYGQGFAAEFDWVGTRDPSPWLCAEAALDFAHELGFDRIRAHNIALRRRAQGRLAERLGLARPAPESMCAALGTLPLPLDVPATRDAADTVNRRLWDEHRIEAFVMPFEGRVWMRIATQIYNTPDDYERLAEALESWT